jgi:hypothetical protein
LTSLGLEEQGIRRVRPKVKDQLRMAAAALLQANSLSTAPAQRRDKLPMELPGSHRRVPGLQDALRTAK